MAVRDIFKISFKTFVNPAGWLGYDTLSMQNATIWNTLKAAFAKPAPAREETFEQAVKRLHLTEQDVEEGVKNYRFYAIMFCIFGLITFMYAFYLLFRYTTIIGWLLAIVASALFFGQAFRYDFWSFQMRRRKLGATFAEWKREILGG